MRLHLLRLAVIAAIVAPVGSAAREKAIFNAQVFLDRTTPERAISVNDFRLAAEPDDRRGRQVVVVYSQDGTFQVPFETITEIDINRPIGRSGDVARYDAVVKLKQGGPRSGRIELHSLRGVVDGTAWHLLVTLRDDRGAALHRIVFVN